MSNDYLHPSVSTKITDNSYVFQTATGNTALFQCIVSEKGEDGVLRMITTPEEFIFKYGEPNLSKYGQGSYNVIRWLQSGGVAYVLRVLPETATFAVTGLGVVVSKLAAGAGAEVVVRNLNGATVGTQFTQVAGFDAFIAAQKATSTATDIVVPLGVVYPYGRGAGYAGLGVRITLRDDMDATYAFRTYSLEITGKDSLGADIAVDGPYLVSFDPLAKNKSRESVYWANVINKYSNFARVRDNRTAFDDITEAMLESVTLGVDVDPSAIDIIFGQVRDADSDTLYAPWTWITEVADLPATVTLTEEQLFDPAKPLYLTGGTDGAWTAGDSEESLLVKGYTGLIDSSILDVRANEFDILLDANTSPAVKNAMAALASDIRGDCLAILDLGFQANESQTVAYRKDSVGMSHRNVAIWAHDMEVYDEFNGENVKVTTPYLLASRIPTVDSDFGIHWPFVGPRRGVISGFENINFIPNEIWKEQLYKAQINYIEKDPKKVNLATQLTSQVQNSALSDVNNVRALLRIKREVEKMMADYRMEFNDSTTHDSMNYDLNNYLQGWVANRCCKTISGTVYASDYDRQQKLVRVKIEMVFAGIIERVAIEIVINR